jgi:hypothetical protein
MTPWMIIYQQSAIADKKLLPEQYAMARSDTVMACTQRRHASRWHEYRDLRLIPLQ